MFDRNVPYNILLTGATGFVGHHIVEHLMHNTTWNILGTYRNSIAGDFRRLDEILYDHQEWNQRLDLLHCDLRDPIRDSVLKSLPPIDVVLHVGANSHVDRSITDPRAFLIDNVEGTVNLLEATKQIKPKLFLYFSTDEVFGNADDELFHSEDAPHRPRNPYAASKAAAEDFCHSYMVTYNIPMIITNTMNVIGERQDPEKYVPKIINNVLHGRMLSIHSYPDKARAGQRHYLHARNAAAATLFVLEHGTIGERYNVVGEEEIDNLTLAQTVQDYINDHLKVELPLVYELVDFHSSRPGHDLRYALSGDKLKSLGYTHPVSFRDSLRRTVEWTLDNPRWLV